MRNIEYVKLKQDALIALLIKKKFITLKQYDLALDEAEEFRKTRRKK